MVVLELDGDNVVVKWTGKRNRSSLYHTMAKGNAENVNKLDKMQCLAVILAAKNAPFGNKEEVFPRSLELITTGKVPDLVKMSEEHSLGEIRKLLVEEAGSGCNAPFDGYITVAAKSLTPAI